MKLSTSDKTSVIIYAGEEKLERFYMVDYCPDIAPGDILIVNKAQANTILHSNVGFVAAEADTIEELYAQASKFVIEEPETDETETEEPETEEPETEEPETEEPETEEPETE